jgi:nicotinate-nucleotide adenylyltransferase
MIRAFFGGSFDPVHAGHVAIIDLLLDRGLADVVHVVPAGHSPFKAPADTAAAAHRLTMLEQALAGRDAVVIDARELSRDGPSYTVDTLCELRLDYPEAAWRLVIGADQAREFTRWRQAPRLLTMAEVVVIARGPVSLAEPLAGRALVVADFDHQAAARDLRRELAAGRRPGAELLPPAVTDHIVANRLYGWPGGGRTP